MNNHRTFSRKYLPHVMFLNNPFLLHDDVQKLYSWSTPASVVISDIALSFGRVRWHDGIPDGNTSYYLVESTKVGPNLHGE